jgi:hypothetical protein
MRQVEHLSLESLVKMDHFQKEPPMTGIEPMGLGTYRRTFECDQCGHERRRVACQILI